MNLCLRSDSDGEKEDEGRIVPTELCETNMSDGEPAADDRVCEECNETVPASLFDQHMDFHFAANLQKQFDHVISTPGVPTPASAPPRVQNKSVGGGGASGSKVKKQAKITSFFRKT